VYASFQHDRSSVEIVEATGYRNVMWGDDYPHLEGTYGHTQATLRDLFAGVDHTIRERVTRGTFDELFDLPAQTPQEAAV
jgi:predicted TIM-barrel fold metal-dependent hydrolase